MIAAGQRLANLSGLTGVSAAEHLRAIAGVYGTAGAMLVAYSGLGPNTAAVHLMHDRLDRATVTGGVLVAPKHQRRDSDDDVLLFLLK